MKRFDTQAPGQPQSSSVLVGPGLLASPPAEVVSWLEGRTVFVVTSQALQGLLRHRLAPMLDRAGRVVDLTLVPDGEAAKTIEIAGRLWEEMLGAGGKRDSLLVTLGGGSVGDLGGFVAGCFLRGIDYLQAPTTMLAQVDASVGGKTAVNLQAGKNYVGRFHHPRFVLADTETLQTLPVRELRSGLVEAIKMAALLDVAMFEEAERDLESWLAGDADALVSVVEGSVKAKLGVVEKDPEERLGLRRLLNFGHTLGHALEKAWGFADVCHGEAVAYGMLFAVRLSEAQGICRDDLGDRLRALLRQLELPPLPVHRLSVDQLMAHMSQDKKATEAGLTWVLPAGLGQGDQRRVEPGLVAAQLSEFLADPWCKPALE